MNKAAVRASVIADAFKRAETTNDYLAEWFVRTSSPYGSTKPDHRISAPVMQAELSMVVWILKREVRAIGGCLGIHRR
jgi:hypothetical protein